MSAPKAAAMLDIDVLVNRFLAWRLPDDFAPDCGISFQKTHSENAAWGPKNYEPIGTNLLTAEQTKAMLLHVLAVEPQQAIAADASFQGRVQPWLLHCFGAEIAGDCIERNHRFLEEALELVQACSCTADEAHKLVDYVFGRPVGEKSQEVGGAMVTLAALCLAQGIDMHEAGEAELSRIWTKVEAIREKQKRKAPMSPLPGAYSERQPSHDSAAQP